MDIYYVLVFISVILSVNCKNHTGNKITVESHEKNTKNISATGCGPPNGVIVPTFVICLLGVSMAVMLFAIIYLAIALSKIKRKIYIHSERRQFLREESNWQSCEDVAMRDKYRNNESTLTVNSGVIQVNRCSEPETPTRTDTDIKIYVTKPPGSVPILHKKQMEEIITHVLNRSKKTASTSLRELNELQNEVNNKPTVEACREKAKEVNNVINNENNFKINKVNDVENTENVEMYNSETNEQAIEVNNEKPKEEVLMLNKKVEIEEVETKEVETKVVETKEVETKEVETKEVETKELELKKEELEQAMARPASVFEVDVYDTVPTPIRTKDDTDSSPLYDCPPSESKPLYDSPPIDNNLIYDCPPRDKDLIYDCPPRDKDLIYDCPPKDNSVVSESSPSQTDNMLLFDPDTEYIMPITRRDTYTYMNARTPRK